MAASQQLFYCIRPPLDRILGGIRMLVLMVKFSLDGCLAATILSNPAPTGSSTYDKVQKNVLEEVKKALI